MPQKNCRYANGNARRKLRDRLRKSGIDHCPHCGVPLDWERPYQPNSAELDEIFPHSRIPVQYRAQACVDPANVQVLCRRCNKLKGNRVGGDVFGDAARKPQAPSRPVTSEEW